MAEVFKLNMSFDAPVKIHLLLMRLVLPAQQIQRMANVLVLERPSASWSRHPRLSTNRNPTGYVSTVRR